MIKDIFKHLNTLLKNKDTILKTRLDICNVLIKESGLFTQKHLPFRLGALLRLWTNNSHWKITKNGDTVYIYAVKLQNLYSTKINAYGWSIKQQKVIILKDLSYAKMFNDAAKVGVELPTTKKSIEELIRDLK